MARKKVETIDDKILGPEPQWLDQDSLSPEEFRSKYANALNWYNYFSDKKSNKKFVTQYVKKFDDKNSELLNAIRKVPDWAVGITLTSICRMRLNGLTRKLDKDDNFIKSRFEEIINHASTIIEEQEETKVDKPVISIQQRVTESASKLTDPIEDAIEEFASSGYKKAPDFDAYKYCNEQQIKPMIAKRIREFYIGETEELEEALLGKDEQLVEGYSHFKKAELKRYAKFMRGMVDDIERYANNKKTTRKPRKKKETPVSKQIAKLKYCAGVPEMKIVSVPPEKVVGAMAVWVYNTKYRRLGKYVANSREGFKFKGTSILGYDEKASVSKTLRKPEEVLDRLLKGGKIVMRKLLDEIKTQEKPLNGRFNEDTVIVKVADE